MDISGHGKLTIGHFVSKSQKVHDIKIDLQVLDRIGVTISDLLGFLTDTMLRLFIGIRSIGTLCWVIRPLFVGSDNIYSNLPIRRFA